MKPHDSFYQELGVTARASAADIEKAYQDLLRKLSSDAHGLSEEEARARRDFVNQAYWVLSDKARRAGYDASLIGSEPTIEFAVDIREERWSPQKILLIVIGGLLAVAIAAQIVLSLYFSYRAKTFMDDTTRIADNRSQSEMEERRREAEERRAAEAARREERERTEAAQKYERQLEEDRRYAAQVSANLRTAEERAERDAEREKRRAEQEEKAKQDAERRRIQAERERWRRQLGYY